MNKKTLAKKMAEEGITYVPWEDFHKSKEEIDKKYNTFMVWSIDEDGDCEYRNTNSFYGTIMQKGNGHIFLLGDENRTEEQAYSDRILRIK